MIEINQLSKMYPGGKGIKDLSFEVKQGEIFGFLGPNGAGKTTTIRILMGFLRPDSGAAKIRGRDTWQERTGLKRIIGYLPGELHFFDRLSAQEILLLFIQMHGNHSKLKENYKKLIKRFDLDIRQPVWKMSKGMKQKLGLISAFMLNAEILLLDEPTSGLDPLMQKVFIDLVLEEKEKGTTVLMSSHQFSEIEKTCGRVGMIREGELLTVEDIAQLKQIKRQTFDIRTKNEEAAQYLRQSGLHILHEEGLSFRIETSGNLNVLWRVLAETQIEEFHQQPLELEETFMQYYH
ncbi:ABC transporter related protein [Syntrophobotulus glycolicus DSM 8271]|uniref:ABC transporter related protein n=1 Tax=Syntrophobotulus glycolicus (strain DSM 8271 / FlGlyR) TaxID=645991 RepID=F0T2V7_SYNGF|nr:ABC transporter ATP-binding protein [Syntrophobotulus glycolicus]ADY57594.1 ABC transporter related protein [Syntrophobotulus glycolicus DSM 8271]